MYKCHGGITRSKVIVDGKSSCYIINVLHYNGSFRLVKQIRTTAGQVPLSLGSLCYLNSKRIASQVPNEPIVPNSFANLSKK